MNTKIYKFILGSLLLLAFTTFTSCDEVGDDGGDPGGTAVEAMAGDWYIQLLVDGEDVYGLGYNLITTYNTSSNTNEMFIDDHELWPAKVKCPVNINDLTFSGTDLENEYSYTSEGVAIYPSLTITNGIIVEDGATTSGGNTSHSITYDVVFSDDPNTTYTITGYKRTGFPEDEH